MVIKNDNKFHKDNMDYNYEEDYFSCFNQERLTYQKTNIKWDEKKEDFIIERIYSNKEACSQCKYCNECCSTKYREVKVSGGLLALNMDKKMHEYENILKYFTRFSTVEAPNGTLKVFYHINEILSTGKVNIQNRLNICEGSYNLIRLFHLLMEKESISEENVLDVSRKFCELTNAVMPIWRNNILPFLDEVLYLHYVCESVVEQESMLNNDNMLNDGQIVLMDVAN